LSGELGPAPGADGSKDFLHTIPASYDALQDMKLLEPMMKRLADRAVKAAVDKAAGLDKSVVPKGMEADPTQSKKLGRQLGEEVVRLMLENLTQDRRLLNKVRNALKAMEPVLIKLSQSDPRFFSERAHPARQLLEKLTSRSLAFSSENEPGYARFLKLFEDAVQILSQGDGDAGTFARVLHTLEENWKREEENHRVKADVAARGLLQAEQRNLLAQRIAQEMAPRMQGKKIPDLVISFLRGPWSQVIAEAQLKFQDHSVNPEECQSLVDDLLWSVQTKLARRNRTRLVEMVPPMLVKLRQGLRLISYPEERTAAFLDELIALHEKAFEGARQTSANADSGFTQDTKDYEQVGHILPAEVPAATDVPEEALWTGDAEDSDLGYLSETADIQLDFTQSIEQASFVDPTQWSTDSLNTGSWVDLALGGQWVRAQLTWTSPHRTLFMFISSGGMAHSMSRRTMERLRSQNLIRLISDRSVMDNALDAVAQAALRNDIQKAGGEG
jgi:hypothetical protein